MGVESCNLSRAIKPFEPTLAEVRVSQVTVWVKGTLAEG